MKRKRAPIAGPLLPGPAVPETIVPEAIMEQAKRAIESDRFRKPVACSVCGGECAPGSNEKLCWVCRRLKLSAWRDSDSQMPAQE